MKKLKLVSGTEDVTVYVVVAPEWLTPDKVEFLDKFLRVAGIYNQSIRLHLEE